MGRRLGPADMLFIAVFTVRRPPLRTARGNRQNYHSQTTTCAICCLRAAWGSSLVDEFERYASLHRRGGAPPAGPRSPRPAGARSVRVGPPWADWMAALGLGPQPVGFSPSLNASLVAAVRMRRSQLECGRGPSGARRRCDLLTALRIAAVFRERASPEAHEARRLARARVGNIGIRRASLVATYEAKRSARAAAYLRSVVSSNRRVRLRRCVT